MATFGKMIFETITMQSSLAQRLHDEINKGGKIYLQERNKKQEEKYPAALPISSQDFYWSHPMVTEGLSG